MWYLEALTWSRASPRPIHRWSHVRAVSPMTRKGLEHVVGCLSLDKVDNGFDNRRLDGHPTPDITDSTYFPVSSDEPSAV